MPPSHPLLFRDVQLLRPLIFPIQLLLQLPALHAQPLQLPISLVQHSLLLPVQDVLIQLPIVLSLQLLFRDVRLRQHLKLLLLGVLLLQPQGALVQLCPRPLLQVFQLPLPLIFPSLLLPPLLVSDALPLRPLLAHVKLLPRLLASHVPPLQLPLAHVELMPQLLVSISLLLQL